LKQWLADSQRLFARGVFDPANSDASFTISSNDYMQQALLLPLVKALRREAKQIHLAISPPIIEGLGEALARGQIDLAVTIPEFAMSDLRHGYFTVNAMSLSFVLSILSRAVQP